MADIPVNLKVKVDAASVQAAGRQMGETVQRAAGSGKSGPAGSPFAGMSGMKVSDAVALANARKAAASGGGGGIGVGRAAAIGGVAGAGASVVLQAVNASLRGLSVSMQSLTNSMNRAAALYAKQLQSGGLPGGFIAQRSALASVIGVSEDQVYQYGDAVQSLNQRLLFSSRINAETNRNVTGAAWGMRVLGEDFKALASVAANELAPSIRIAAQAAHNLAVSFGSDFAKVFAKALKHIVEASAASTLGPFAYIMRKFISNTSDPGAAPAASVSSKRLQSSSWERMGLVIGQGVNSNPLKATERNTRQTAVLLKDIRAFLSPRSSATGPRLDRTAVNGA